MRKESKHITKNQNQQNTEKGTKRVKEGNNNYKRDRK